LETDKEDMMPLPRKAIAYTPETISAMRADHIRTIRATLAGFVSLAKAGDKIALAEIRLAAVNALSVGDTEISEIYDTAIQELR